MDGDNPVQRSFLSEPYWWLTVILVPPVIIILVKWFTYKRNKIAGIYTAPGCGCWAKKMWAACIIGWRRRKIVPRMNNYNLDSMSYENCGLVPSKEETEMESVKPLGSSFTNDSMFIFGVDNSGNTLIIKLARKPGRSVEVWLHAKLKGVSYQYPDHPDSTVSTGDDLKFSGGGLKLQVLEPMKTWRVVFNGLLRKGVHQEWIEEECKLTHVKFNFIWSALTEPVDCGEEFNPMLSDALARETWADVFAEKFCCSDGYDQWGTLYGAVKIGDADEEIYHLRGVRQRRWKRLDCTNMHREVNIHGCLKNGTMFTLGASSHTTGLTQLLSGHMKAPNGNMYRISKCDLRLAELAEDGDIPKQFVIRFRANGKWSTINICTKDPGFRVFGGRPWTTMTDCVMIDCTLDLKEGSGIAEFTYSYNGRCPLPPEEPSAFLLAPKLLGNRERPLVVSLADTTCQNTVLVGGKAASLALITTINDSRFTVPHGFCITVAGFERQLQSTPELKKMVQSVEDVAWGRQDGDLQKICQNASDLFVKCSLCQSVEEAVEHSLTENFPDGWTHLRFAVRSSAIGEDSEELSAAGQNDTFLGCGGLPQVLGAVAKCWASLFSLQSVEYRRQHGQLIQTGMGVVVQQMVGADVAGVLFTRDPVTGNPARMVITANYGLGESVVSAMAEPDMITLQRKWNNSPVVEKTTIGSKETKVMMQDGEGTMKEKVDTEIASHICLSNEMAVTLGEIGIMMENIYVGPRDIEWAVSKGRVFLLQSRPITSFDAWTDFELIHELDTSVLTDTEHITKANTGEVFLGACTPLTISTVVKAIDVNAQKMFKKHVGPDNPHAFTPHVLKNLAVSHWHVVINILDTMLSMNDQEEITSRNHAADLAFFGHQATTSEMRKLAVERHGLMSPSEKFNSLLNLMKVAFLGPRQVRQCEERYRNLTFQTDDCYSAQDLYDKITEHLPDLFPIALLHCATTHKSVALQIMSFLTLTQGKTDWGTEIASDFAALVGCCSANVESADVPAALKELAASIASCAEAAQFISMSAEDAVGWLQKQSGETGRKYKDFLQKHGHRCIKEFDLQTLPWDLEPQKLLHTLQSMVKNPTTYTWKKKEASIEKAMENLKMPLTSNMKRALRFLLPFCHVGIRAREQTKSVLIRTIHQLRLAYRVLADRLVREGRLPRPELIFFFTHPELASLLQTRSPALIAKAVRRRRLFPQLDALQFPEIMVGLPLPKGSEEETHESTVGLAATPVSQGKARGPARVVLDLAAAASIQKGDILITYSTDVGWSPYFPLLGGVATEIGGLISHGAVVAREYGLPCIVGAHNATRIFKSGEDVVLDGTKGTLEKCA